ncbi:hypothetical protein K435DRAFT_785312 [Dendrothele bispora CBS 962.96]|uniref:Uncharacterized protein n=1 Tax=Dendrothele bispora (strain CBS 962.96) TaxID=1314807 RepID=A0A4S8KXS2_DENBC|nr:hypothetical protein K435DRAFT_785312 [Dendrothele bispora CBS 962.96]
MINAEVIPDEHQSTTTRTVSQTLPSSALCYNGIRVIPCTRPPVNPLPKKLHFPPLRVNHNANAIANVPQPSRIEVSSPPSPSRQKSASTSPTLPPTVFQTPPPRQLVLTSPPTPPPPPPCETDATRPLPSHSGPPHASSSIRSCISSSTYYYSSTTTTNIPSISHFHEQRPGSPLQSLFDHTSIRILRDISHLQTSCYAVLHNERREKEVMRVKMMRMKRERDLAWERLRGVNVVAQNTHARQSLKRHRSDGDVDDMMVSMVSMAGTGGLPTPPLSSDINKPSTLTSVPNHGANALEIDGAGVGVDDSSDLDLDLDPDKYTLNYPSPSPYPYPNSNSYFSQHQHSPHNTNTSSNSPPPPPISGRRLFFDTSPSSSNLSNPTPAPASHPHPHTHTHDLSSPIHLDSETSAKAKKRGPRPLTADVLSRDPDNHEEYLRQRRGVKRRRVVVGSESETEMEREMESSMSPVPFGFSSAQSSDKSSSGSGSGSGDDTLVNDSERQRTHSPYLSTSSKEEDIISRILSPPHLTTTLALLATTLPGLPGGCDSAAGRPLSPGYSSDSDCSGLSERDMDLESESESESDAESVEVPLSLPLSSSSSMTKVDDRSGGRARICAGDEGSDKAKGFELVTKEVSVRQRMASEKEEEENVKVDVRGGILPSTSTTLSRKSPLQSRSSVSISRIRASTSNSVSTSTSTPVPPAASSGPTRPPKTPSPDPDPSPKQTPSILKGLPKLDLKDLGQMFVQEGDRIHCRLCPRSESGSGFGSRSPPNLLNTPSSSFTPTPASTPNLDAMIQHCTHSHPKAYSDVSGLSLDQVYMLRSVLGERSSGASASFGSERKGPKEV